MLFFLIYWYNIITEFQTEKEESELKKFFIIFRVVLAVLLIIIGVIGLIIPVFPTVPFLVLAAVVLGKKPSEVIKFFNWISKNVQLHLKRIIRRFRKKRLKNHD